jgi:outer membrane protein assembly factor BamB
VGSLFVNGYGDGPRGTPTVDGELIYALGGQGNLVCVRAADGTEVWRKSMQRDLAGRMMSGWGYTESPLVDGDKLVCTPGGRGGAVAALNKKTGEVLWRSKEFIDPASYSSLVVSEAGGVRQYAQMTGESVAGVAADDGRLLWRYPRPSRTAAIPTPVVSEDYVYVTSGYNAGCALLKLTPSAGKKFTVQAVYDNKNLVNQHGGVVLLDGYVYGFSDNKGWVCQDFKSGKVLWQERNKLGKGSLTAADGRLYCYSEQDGTAVLTEASPKGWKEAGRFTIPEHTSQRRKRSPNIWTHPVVANGRLYLRDQDLLFCYDVKDSGAR